MQWEQYRGTWSLWHKGKVLAEAAPVREMCRSIWMCQVTLFRPSIITDHVRARDTRAARELIRIKEAEAKGTPDGTLPRDEPALRAVAKGIRKSYAPIQAEIPAD
jgi:hypothetical protein